MSNSQSANSRYQCDAAIVGAGLSGIYAASLLAEKGLDVIVLEAADRIGGRILTEHPTFAPFIDAGAQYISPGQDRILGLLKKYQLNTFPVFEEGKQIFYKAGKRFLKESLFDNEAEENETLRLASALTEMAESVPLDKPWECPYAKEWDAQSLNQWLARESESIEARSHIIQSIEGVYAPCPGSTSLLGALFCIRSGDPLVPFVSPSAEPELRIDGGAGQLLHCMAEDFTGRVILNTRIDDIHTNDKNVEVFGKEVIVEAKNVIVTLPPPLAARIHYEPPLPAMRDQLMQRTPLEWVAKVHCVYQNPFWRKEGLSGAVLSDSGTVRICTDNSPPSGKPGIILAFIEGQQALHLSALTSSERSKAILKDLVRYFGPQAKDIIGYHEKSWAEDPYCRGCYGGFFPQGVWTTCGPALKRPIGKIHWAGTETSAVWNGKMEGALLSAETVVRLISDS